MKDTTDTDWSASYLDLHLKIDSEEWLRKKLYDNRQYFNFPLETFHICSNIPCSTIIWSLYLSVNTILHNLWFISEFPDRGLLLTRKLLKQWFILVKLKSSLREGYGRNHDLVDRYGISIHKEKS
jgi:hypothetical protein